MLLQNPLKFNTNRNQRSTQNIYSRKICLLIKFKDFQHLTEVTLIVIIHKTCHK